MKRIIRTIVHIFVIGISVASIPLVIAIYIVGDSIHNSDATKKLLTYSESIIAGNIRKTIDVDGYTIHIHEAVFPGALWNSNSGFIQIDFPLDKERGSFSEPLDFNGDGKEDALVMYDFKNDACMVEPLSEKVGGIADTYIVQSKKSQFVRIKVKR